MSKTLERLLLPAFIYMLKPSKCLSSHHSVKHHVEIRFEHCTKEVLVKDLKK
ncbi:hypothetical protein [Phaffia rhodozyma]|uniref:Uncharacterized protein n=1 Tax=Phaffia rhodozyma TaxID=264483 RepID=A0A0F7SJG2_PHARH|nr:hypothetical protein [Phaffia rhodozyma]